jgi:hypothetical protein
VVDTISQPNNCIFYQKSNEIKMSAHVVELKKRRLHALLVQPEHFATVNPDEQLRAEKTSRLKIYGLLVG